jgi:AraC-type DNA-binding domain-containing proteins
MTVGKAIAAAGPGGAETRVATRFFPVSAALRPYASTIYLTEIDAPPGERVEDYLHPEWANLRFIAGEPPLAAIAGATPAVAPAFIAAGPTSMATYFAAGTMRAWGVGLLPMGWAKFVPLSAEALADRFCDGAAHPSFAAFAPLGPLLAAANSPERDARMIDAHLVGLLAEAPPDEPAILAAHCALVDDDLRSVADLAAVLNLSERSVERLSRRAFGFPPKLLLRRQRFLRSLARFMLDPSMAWTATLDHHYHDQAQFTRDFQRFMGMSPRTYAARSKPILGAAALARAAAAGEAVQGLHRPQG